jgi:hypothetical protein
MPVRARHLGSLDEGHRDRLALVEGRVIARANRPEPRVQPLVAQVRQELARLVGEMPGRN